MSQKSGLDNKHWENVGDRIRTLRTSRSFSQKELAEIVGVSQVAISKIESGGMPSIETLIALSMVFERTLEDLVMPKDMFIHEILFSIRFRKPPTTISGGLEDKTLYFGCSILRDVPNFWKASFNPTSKEIELHDAKSYTIESLQKEIKDTILKTRIDPETRFISIDIPQKMSVIQDKGIELKHFEQIILQVFSNILFPYTTISSVDSWSFNKEILDYSEEIGVKIFKDFDKFGGRLSDYRENYVVNWNYFIEFIISLLKLGFDLKLHTLLFIQNNPNQQTIFSYLPKEV